MNSVHVMTANASVQNVTFDSQYVKRACTGSDGLWTTLVKIRYCGLMPQCQQIDCLLAK